MTEMITEDIITHVKGWLGDEGITHFQTIKEMHGKVDALWMEAVSINNMQQYTTRCIYTQEGAVFRTFLKSLEECKEWETKDFKEQWVPIIEKSIEVEESEE